MDSRVEPCPPTVAWIRGSHIRPRSLRGPRSLATTERLHSTRCPPSPAQVVKQAGGRVLTVEAVAQKAPPVALRLRALVAPEVNGQAHSVEARKGSAHAKEGGREVLKVCQPESREENRRVCRGSNPALRGRV